MCHLFVGPTSINHVKPDTSSISFFPVTLYTISIMLSLKCACSVFCLYCPLPDGMVDPVFPCSSLPFTILLSCILDDFPEESS